MELWDRIMWSYNQGGLPGQSLSTTIENHMIVRLNKLKKIHKYKLGLNPQLTSLSCIKTAKPIHYMSANNCTKYII